MIWQMGATLVLLAFYSIYLGKMLIQKKKGIQTDQMARGKKKDRLYYTELVLKVITYSIVAVEVVSIVGNISLLNSVWRSLGLCISVFGVIVFGIAVWTMRDSWRAGIPANDKTEMVTDGIYRFCC